LAYAWSEARPGSPWGGRLTVIRQSLNRNEDTGVTRQVGTVVPVRRKLAVTTTLGGCALICAVALIVAGCSGGRQGGKPVGPTQEQIAAAAAKRAQEEKAAADQMAAEQDALAKQAEQEEARRQAQIEADKLPPEFGTPSTIAGTGESKEMGTATSANDIAAAAAPKIVTIAPVLVPQKLPPPVNPDATPYDKAFPPLEDHAVRIGIISGSSQATAAQSLARMLSNEDRKYLEDTLGLGVKVAYVSETNRPETRQTQVHYRPDFLKAAVQIAALLPPPQKLDVMSDAEATRHGVDVLVQVGTDLR
jgi:hypothetical protein